MSYAERETRLEIASLLTGDDRDVQRALERLRAMPDGGMEVIRELVQDESRYHRHKRIWAWTMLCIMIAVWATYNLKPHHDIVRLLEALCFTAVALSMVLATSVALKRKSLALVLADCSGPDTVGLMLAISDRLDLPPYFEKSLTSVLLALDEAHTAALTHEDRIALCRLLKKPDDELVMAALIVLARIGRTDDLPAIHHLMKLVPTSRPPNVRAAAEFVASQINLRLERQRVSDVLLRPADPAADTLLRPAATAQSDPSLLLRVEVLPGEE